MFSISCHLQQQQHLIFAKLSYFSFDKQKEYLRKTKYVVILERKSKGKTIHKEGIFQQQKGRWKQLNLDEMFFLIFSDKTIYVW